MHIAAPPVSYPKILWIFVIKRYRIKNYWFPMEKLSDLNLIDVYRQCHFITSIPDVVHRLVYPCHQCNVLTICICFYKYQKMCVGEMWYLKTNDWRKYAQDKSYWEFGRVEYTTVEYNAVLNVGRDPVAIMIHIMHTNMRPIQWRSCNDGIRKFMFGMSFRRIDFIATDPWLWQLDYDAR